MSAFTPEPAAELPRKSEAADAEQQAPTGVILERFKRMQTLPPHLRSRQDEFFVQSYLRKKRFDL